MDVVKEVLRRSNIKELNEMQKKAIKEGLKGKNLLISSPTGSGKTLVAEVIGLNNIINGKGKVVYLTPLKAIALEKYKEFKEKYKDVAKVAISIGDYDSEDKWLSFYDFIILTVEKFDSLLRHKAFWVKEVSTVIVDEVHLLNDESRGVTLEILITKLLKLLKAQFVCLSATITNAKEIANWLNASLIVSNYRPIKLEEGVFYDNKIYFVNREEEIREKENDIFALIKDTIKKGKQALIFVNTRKRSESLAKKISKFLNEKKLIKKEDKEKLIKIAWQVLNVLERPTKQCKEESECIINGVAFHHAGLIGKQREIIEDNFRKGIIKFIVATPTLAMGVNLPSYRVIIRDVYRYSLYGLTPISVMEYKQMAGRAGRIGYDEKGEAILIAKSEDDVEFLKENYILNEPEPVTSKLNNISLLRFHLLSLICEGFIKTLKDAVNFFKSTFYYSQFKNLEKEKIEMLIDELISYDFVKKDKYYEPTLLGLRVSQLYIDPLSAFSLIKGIRKMKDVIVRKITFLSLICNTVEMEPLLKVNRKEREEIEFFYEKFKDSFVIDVDYGWEYENFLRVVKTSLLFFNWINEASEDEILDKFKVTPGELYMRLTNADWLLYSLEELARILKEKEVINEVAKLRLQLKYGVKEELLPLIKLKGIGRVKARILYNAGIRNISELKKADVQKLIFLIGKETTKKVLEQIKD